MTFKPKISRFVSSAAAPGRCGKMSSERDQIVREIAMFPGHLTIAAACLMMDAAVEVPPALVKSIKAFNDAVAPVLCDERRMEQVIRFVEGLDIRGLRVLRDVAVELLQGLVRKLH
jgi:hypothetical protein